MVMKVGDTAVIVKQPDNQAVYIREKTVKILELNYSSTMASVEDDTGGHGTVPTSCLKVPSPILASDFGCPLCGQMLKWSCQAQDGSLGSGNCQDGPNVSRNLTKSGCRWAGTEVYRKSTGDVVVLLPVSLKTIPSREPRP